MKRIFETVKKTLNDICLIDMILMAYMGILLIYIAIHLICSTPLQESTSVDTIIRTSASAIFGYIISNNFISSNSDTKVSLIKDLKIFKSLIKETFVSEFELIKLLLIIYPKIAEADVLIIVSTEVLSCRGVLQIR